MPQNLTFYDPDIAMWGDPIPVPISLARVGVDRKTGRMIVGYIHVRQSMEAIYETPFHERILRRWVGSFVPHILGESTVARVITRFYWAMASALDLWEPNYRIKKILVATYALADAFSPPPNMSAAEMLRGGHMVFRHIGIYRPRAHLGDPTPMEQRQVGLVGRGMRFWDTVPMPLNT